MNDEQANLLASFTDKELRQELYRRNKPIRVSERDKPKCGNCKHKVCYTDAVKMKKKGLLDKKISTMAREAICLVNEDNYAKGYYKRINNNKTCDKFESKEK